MLKISILFFFIYLLPYRYISAENMKNLIANFIFIV